MVLRGNSATTNTRLGTLKFRNLGFERRDQRVAVGFCARAWHHDRGDGFAEIGMRHADHRGFGHGRPFRRDNSRSPSDRRCSRR